MNPPDGHGVHRLTDLLALARRHVTTADTAPDLPDLIGHLTPEQRHDQLQDLIGSKLGREALCLGIAFIEAGDFDRGRYWLTLAISADDRSYAATILTRLDAGEEPGDELCDLHRERQQLRDLLHQVTEWHDAHDARWPPELATHVRDALGRSTPPAVPNHSGDDPIQRLTTILRRHLAERHSQRVAQAHDLGRQLDDLATDHVRRYGIDLTQQPELLNLLLTLATDFTLVLHSAAALTGQHPTEITHGWSSVRPAFTIHPKEPATLRIAMPTAPALRDRLLQLDQRMTGSLHEHLVEQLADRAVTPAEFYDRFINAVRLHIEDMTRVHLTAADLPNGTLYWRLKMIEYISALVDSELATALLIAHWKTRADPTTEPHVRLVDSAARTPTGPPAEGVQ